MRKLLLATTLLFTLFSNAQQLDSIRHVLDSAYAKAPFCANILLLKDDKVIFEKSYGYADAVKQTPLKMENSFQVASVSKQFTAYGIMLLAHQKLLNYDSTVKTYIPQFPYNNITIRHMLNHTSGLPEFWDGIRPKLDTTKSYGNKEVLEYLIDHHLPLQSEPGSKYAYADIGYDFLALIIEKVSGKSYQQYMHDNIFKPLKMKSTYAYMVTDIERIDNKQLAPGHVWNAATGRLEYAHLQPYNHFVFYLGDFYGDGSVVTTAHDLALWDKALRKCELLSCKQQQEAFTIPLYKGTPVEIRAGLGYGFGWFIKPGMAYHSGRHPGNIHGIYHQLNINSTFIFLSNSEIPDILRLRSRILSLLE
jgi:CubicO group peptidase (beta-lactamase class C family)